MNFWQGKQKIISRWEVLISQLSPVVHIHEHSNHDNNKPNSTPHLEEGYCWMHYDNYYLERKRNVEGNNSSPNNNNIDKSHS